MNPRIISEFEGGPSHVYLGKHPINHDEENKNMVFWALKLNPVVNQMLSELKSTPTLESITYEKMPLFNSCEECDECEADTCPRPKEEVWERGSGMELTEILEGWFIDLNQCTPWKRCECCNGLGWHKE